MLLREVELRNWRGLKQIKVGPFKDRLNLITGPNESGKSRIFEAIRFALFESHKGSAQHKAALQSWDSADSPFVRLVFESDGHEYEIQKQYLKGGSALLIGNGSTLRGDDAEEALRVITRARPGSSRAVQDADMGIWPILLIQQGRAGEIPSAAINQDGLLQLHERISAEIGLAAVSPIAQRLLDLARSEYERYYTASGQENKTIRDARKTLSERTQALELAKGGLAQQQAVAESLRVSQDEVRELEDRQIKLVTDLEEATKRADKAAQGALIVTRMEAAVSSRTSGKREADRALQERIDLDAVVSRLANEAGEVRVAIELEKANRDRIDNEVTAARERERQASDTLAQARTQLESFRRERRYSELTQRRTGVAALITQVEEISAALEGEKLRLAGLSTADQKLLDRLKVLEEAAIEARARLHGAAVAICIAIKTDISVDGQAFRAGETLDLDITEDQTFRIGDSAEITVRPGGGALLELRAAVTRCEKELREALTKAGVASPAEATEVFRQRTQSNLTIKSLKERFTATTTKSLPDLRAEIVGIDADIARLGPVQAVEGNEGDFDKAVREAEADEAEARSQFSAETSLLATCRERISTFLGQVQSKDEERKTVETAIEKMDSVTDLQVAAQREQQSLGQAVLEYQAAAQQYSELGGDYAKEDNERARRAVGTIDERLKERRNKVAELRTELRMIVETAPYESMQSAEAGQSAAQSEYARLERRAGAAATLWNALFEARRKLTERLTEPVIARVQPYIQEIFPGSTLDAGEEFSIQGLKSPHYPEPYDHLSGGAREQLALITRIGFAEVLAGNGRLPLLLDDALVNTDPLRMLRVHRVLDRASETLQVIVFTCHDVLFDALGAEAVFTLGSRRYGVTREPALIAAMAELDL